MRVFLFLVNVMFVSLAISTSDLYNRISAQDERVFKLLNKPVKSGGKKLIKSIRKLNLYLELVIKSIYENKEEVKNITMSLLRQGSPKYVNTIINEERLKSEFGWTDQLLIKMYEEMKKTQKLFHFIKIAYESFFSCLF